MNQRTGVRLSRQQWLLVGGIVVLLLVGGLGSCSAASRLPAAALPTALRPTIARPVTADPPAPSAPAADPPVPSVPVPSVPAPSVPAPSVSAAPVGVNSVFGLAWFHKPPAEPTSAADIAAQHHYIHLTGLSDVPFRDALRAAGYRGPIYTYTAINGVEGPGPYKNAAAPCLPNYTGLDNNLAWQKDDFCTAIHAHESWFLHNSKGERLTDDYFGTGHWVYLMNPADPGWQAFSYRRLQTIRANWGYDGVWLDNLDIDLDRGLHGEKNSDGQVQEFADTAAWQAGMRVWLAGARAQLGSWPIWANLVGGPLEATAWDAFAPYLDGALDESFAVRWLDGWRDAAAWGADLDRADRWLATGKGLVLVGQGAQDDPLRLRFTLASYLLVAQDDRTFFRYTRFDSYYSNLWLYPEYQTARALGAPLGSRTEVRPGVWQRLFVGGYVEVDVAGHSGRLVPTPKNYDIPTVGRTIVPYAHVSSVLPW